MEIDKKTCPIIDVDGFIEKGKQFDLDIILPEDDRNVIYGIVRDCYKDPVPNAVVKLIEVICNHKGEEERKTVSHTFTDCDGEFVFGPLCPDRQYAIQIWVNDTKKIKICAKCHHEATCLKGEKHDKCDCYIDDRKEDCPCKKEGFLKEEDFKDLNF